MLTKRIQMQAIIDYLHDPAIQFDAHGFDEPWVTIWQAMQGKDTHQERVEAIAAALQGRDDSEKIFTEVLSTRSRVLQFESLKDIAGSLPPIRWLWPGWIPRGMITLLGAVPGAGKTLLCQYWAHQISSSRAWPDGSPIPNPGANVLYVDAENVPQILNERAEAWQMDRSKLFIMLPDKDEMIDLVQEKYRERMIEMVAVTRPELMIVDSLGCINSKGENSVEDVRQILGFLNAVAREFQIGLVLIHHLRKRPGTFFPSMDEIGIDDFRGSSHIIAMARSVIGLSVVQTNSEPDPDGPRKLKVVKTNLGAHPKPIGFSLVPMHPKGVILQWGDAPQAYRELSKEDECGLWLEGLLKDADGPLKPKEVVKLAELEGFSRACVFRARKKLGDSIHTTEGRSNPDSAWAWEDDDENR